MSLSLTRNLRLTRLPTSSHDWSSFIAEFARYVASMNTPAFTSPITPDLRNGDWVRITASGGGAFTINAPKGGYVGQVIDLTIRNTSGGALGALTLNAAYKVSAVFPPPANGYSRTVRFRYDGTNWVEVGRTAADVAN